MNAAHIQLVLKFYDNANASFFFSDYLLDNVDRRQASVVKQIVSIKKMLRKESKTSTPLGSFSPKPYV